VSLLITRASKRRCSEERCIDRIIEEGIGDVQYSLAISAFTACTSSNAAGCGPSFSRPAFSVDPLRVKANEAW